ncbi:hypothetical protein IWX90DRAFT_291793 [Phyllosticta citrichinensis]|uniref:Uncharacterized protein n=1 Tax=Phyllosticta citrichinensis TaxID=1130410 RepID=A0ABR1XK44_9PEZI
MTSQTSRYTTTGTSCCVGVQASWFQPTRFRSVAGLRRQAAVVREQFDSTTSTNGRFDNHEPVSSARNVHRGRLWASRRYHRSIMAVSGWTRDTTRVRSTGVALTSCFRRVLHHFQKATHSGDFLAAFAALSFIHTTCKCWSCSLPFEHSNWAITQVQHEVRSTLQLAAHCRLASLAPRRHNQIQNSRNQVRPASSCSAVPKLPFRSKTWIVSIHHVRRRISVFAVDFSSTPSIPGQLSSRALFAVLQSRLFCGLDGWRAQTRIIRFRCLRM